MTEKLEIYIYIYAIIYIYSFIHTQHICMCIYIYTQTYTHTHTYTNKPLTSQKAAAISYTIGGTVNWHTRLVKLCASFLKNSLNFVCPSHSTLRYLPKRNESTVYTNTCTWMFTTAFFPHNCQTLETTVC